MNQNQRPGVYSRYDVSSAYLTPRSGSYCAVAAKATGGEEGRVYAFTKIAELKEVFTAESDAVLYGCVEILLKSGVSRVLAVKVGDGGYEVALALLEGEENVGSLVCDCAEASELEALRASVQRSSDALRERVAYCGVEAVRDAISAAEGLNSERVVLCCPAVSPAGSAIANVAMAAHAAYGAAAMAGLVLAKNDCTWNFSGEALDTVEGPARLAEEDIQAALASGVTILEQCGGAVECVRALTTRTKTAGDTDYALRGLGVVLCIDDVMQNVRASLKACLRGTRLSGRSYQTIQSQVAVVLGGRMEAGVIKSFEAPKAYAADDDPSVCVVELSFHIAHVVSQIHVTAHIQV